MKCSKCNFISFDYNQVCPKCGNDLSHERELMNFPSYKPKNLSLLGVLTGGGKTSWADTLIGQSEDSGASGEGAEELLISLDSLADEEQEPILFEPETSLAPAETKIENEVVFEPETIPSEEAEEKKGGVWETVALEQRMADMELGASEKDGLGSIKAEEAPGEGKEKEAPDLFELELEPLELDMEIEESDKKTS